MRAARIGRWILIGGFALGILIQLVPVDRSNPPVVLEVEAPGDVQDILQRACYDCHSNETNWPWYSRVAPVSWRLAWHVGQGREDLNFSDWPAFDFEQQDLEFDDIRDQIEKDRMPPWDYRLMHPEARLSDAERRTLIEWATP